MTIAARTAALAAFLSTPGLPAASPAEPPGLAEIQINLCAPPEEIIRGLSLAPGPNRSREIWYFESPTLEEFAKGIVFRLRLGANERRLTLKASVPDCERVDAALLPGADGKCELDFFGETKRPAVSLERDLDEKRVRALLDGKLGLASVLTSVQIRYLQVAGAWPLPANLRPLGPIRVDSHRSATGNFVAELWRAPAGERWAEVSRKATVADVPRERTAMLAQLSKAGLEPCADASSPAESKLRALLAAPRPTPGIR